jgi:hypothetical protein
MSNSRVNAVADSLLALLCLLAGASVLGGMAARALAGADFGFELAMWQWRCLGYGPAVVLALWAWWGTHGNSLRRIRNDAKPRSHLPPAGPGAPAAR